MGNDKTLESLAQWAIGRDEVRAMILTSTRAIPGGNVDAYSDYDVVIVVDDVVSKSENRKWLGDFGELLVSYWDPVNVDETTGATWVGSVNNYANGLKIDFSVWSEQRFIDVTSGPNPHPEFDAGHRILVDKDNLGSRMQRPTYRAYLPKPPDEDTYQTVITDFLIGVPYVAKSLLRDELLPAKWVLDFDMRFNYLVPMLQWAVGCEQNWSHKNGMLGKGLRKHLSAETWQALEDTFAGSDSESNWKALFGMITLFDRTALYVAVALGFHYPAELVRNVKEHAQGMRRGDYANGPLNEP